MTFFKQILTTSLFLLLSLSLLAWPSVTMAQTGQVLGIHILHLDELEMADKLISSANNDPENQESRQEWSNITVPFSLADLEKETEWQTFFDQAKERKLIPLVRLITTFDSQINAWQVPTQKNIVDQISFLKKLNWPTDQKHIIVFNEVNHAPEWGGEIDPAGYAQTLAFTTQWAHSESSNFIVMPAAMDLAAPNGKTTMEAFNYLNKMREAEPEVLGMVDVWNSHSYPNPGFSSSPERTAQNSLRGFQHELAFLKEKTGRDFQVYITETGWEVNRSTAPWLERYYSYALDHIWSLPEVLGVTPFVLRGSPGPFSGFSFLDHNDQPTLQYVAFQKALAKTVKN